MHFNVCLFIAIPIVVAILNNVIPHCRFSSYRADPIGISALLFLRRHSRHEKRLEKKRKGAKRREVS